METLRDLLRGSLGRSLRELSEEDRLHAAWPLACGSALASRGEVLHLDLEGVLHVRIADPAWRERFFEVRSTLRDELARIANSRLTALHFEEPRHWRRPPVPAGDAPVRKRRYPRGPGKTGNNPGKRSGS